MAQMEDLVHIRLLLSNGPIRKYFTINQSEIRIYLIGVTVNKTFDKVVMVCCQITIETNPSIGLDLLSFNQIT